MGRATRPRGAALDRYAFMIAAARRDVAPYPFHAERMLAENAFLLLAWPPDNHSRMHPEATILLAEDNQTDCELTKSVFEQARLLNPLKIVNDGAEAINYLRGSGPYSDRAQHPFPVLLLLDIMMPKVTGTEVLRWIRSGSIPIKVVVLTSYRNDPEMDRKIYPGADFYLTKPLRVDNLWELRSALKLNWMLLPAEPACAAAT